MEVRILPKPPARALTLLLVIGLILWMAAASRTNAPPALLTVREFSPQGEVGASSPTIKIVFSSEVAKSLDIGRALSEDDLPLSISPRLRGIGKWEDALTFIYQPTANYLAEATRYEVSVSQSLKDLNGTPLSGQTAFSFNTPPPAFLSARQTSFNLGEEFLEFSLSFNMPVSPATLEGFLSVRDADGRDVPYFLRDQRPSRSLSLRTALRCAPPMTFSVKEGMPAANGSLGLPETVSFDVGIELSMRVLNSYMSDSGYSEPKIIVETSVPVNIERAAAFIEISPDIDFRVEPRWGNSIAIIGGFKPREIVTVKILKGMPAMDSNHTTITELWERAFIVPDLNPKLEFTSPGYFMSSANDEMLIPISSVNIEAVRVTVLRVYDNNVAFAARGGWPYYPDDLSERIFLDEFDVSANPNEKYEFSLDLKKILDGRTGLFDVRVSQVGGWWNEISRVVNVTDIAGGAKISDRGALIWTNSILTGKRLSGVRVGVYSGSHQLVASGVTDEEGVCVIKRDTPWDVNLEPMMAMLELGSDVSILHLNDNIWKIGDASYAGRPYPSGEYQGMCFTPRGVYRPGETVPVDVIIRNADLSAEKPFPVQIMVRASSGREWSKSAVTLSEMGMASSEVRLSDASPTGAWTVDVLIPGDGTPVAHTSFLVEDFSPPKILVAVSADKQEIRRGEGVTLDLFAEYLFGAPGANLNYEISATFIPREYSHPKWSGYRFSDSRISYSQRSGTEATGVLSADGYASADLPKIEDAPSSILDVTYLAGVMEDGGRWVYKSVTLPYYPRDSLLGIQLPEAWGTPSVPFPFSIAAIDTSGQPVDPKNARVTINRVKSYSIITTVDGVRRGEIRYEYTPIDGYENLSISFKDGVYSSSAALNGGHYQIVVEDPSSGAAAAIKFYVRDPYWSYSDAEATLPESLNIRLDKDVYAVGDVATARVSGSFAGSALLTVETDSVLRRETRESGENENVFTFEVTEEMMPNAWVTAHRVRAAVSEDVWSSHRAFGAVPLTVDCSDLALDVETSEPERIEPSARNDFSIRLKDGQGRAARGEAVVMLVDDAVLSLTQYRTPDFLYEYTRRRMLTVRAYDIYEALMPLYLKRPVLLAPGGGDALLSILDASLSPVKAERFKILTEVKRITTDHNGEAAFSFDVPEFSGRARLMAVAVGARSFGASEKFLTIARDVVSDVTLPRALAPGDTFDAQIQLFNRSGASLDVRVELEMTGPLSILGAGGDAGGAEKKLSLDLALPPEDSLHATPLRMRADDESGVASVTLVTTYGGREQRQTTELAVRPPYPRITATGTLRVRPGETAPVELPAGWFPGTRRASVAMSGMPEIGLADAARFLLHYPYSCLEQTVSAGWLFLSLPELVAKIDPNLAARERMSGQLSRCLLRIQSMQVQGGGFSLWPMSAVDDWSSVYAAHFLTALDRKGCPVPSEPLRAALVYLRGLNASPMENESKWQFRHGLALRAYASYVLADNGEPPLAWMSFLRDNIAEMPPYGRFLLAAAYARGGLRDVARSMAAEYAPPLIPKSESEIEQPNYDSQLRTKALQLLAWNAIDPTSASAAAAAAELIRSLNGSLYYTTQETGFAVLSLSEFFSYNNEEGKAELELMDADGSIIATAIGEESVNVTIGDGTGKLSVRNRGDGAGFASWSVAGVPLDKPATENIGVEASVEYTDSSGTPIHANARISRGEKLAGKIKLRPTAGILKNIVVSVPLAGGLEIESPGFTGTEPNVNQDEHNQYVNARAEIRDDRLLLFVDEVNREFAWNFIARAVTSGTFTLPPIAADGMYSPGIRSIGETSRVIIH
ncbi:MAG: hypothetical protein LBS75_08425 [Synergistaceae bacterium]|jgi:uncharacterized protein YfaS (alpha-2-macroglobulin family)|nr:hypothetical protein [Synergistaceae bacterium]